MPNHHGARRVVTGLVGAHGLWRERRGSMSHLDVGEVCEGLGDVVEVNALVRAPSTRPTVPLCPLRPLGR